MVLSSSAITVNRIDCPTATVTADSTGGTTAGMITRRTVPHRPKRNSLAISSRSGSTLVTASRRLVTSSGIVTSATTSSTTDGLGPSHSIPTTTITIGGMAISSCVQDAVSSSTGRQVPAAQPQGNPIRQAIPNPPSAR